MKDLCSPQHISRLLHPLLLLLVTAALLATSCAKKEKEAPDPALPRLEAIEAIVDDYPDSAATSLHAISPDTLRTPASRALYYLLATRIHTRDQIISLADTNIKQSIIFYKSTNDKKRLADSYLYDARRLLLNDSLAEAMMAINDGLQIDVDIITNAKFNNLAADIYLTMNNIQKELVYRSQAYNAYSKSGNTVLYDYCLVLYTTCLINNNEYSKALDIILTDSLRTRPVIKPLLAELTSNKGMCIKYLGKESEAKKFLLDATKIDPEYVSSLAYRTLSDYYLEHQAPDSALYWLQMIPKYHSKDISYYHGMAKLYNKTNDASKALLMTDSMSLLQDKRVDLTLRQEFNNRLNYYEAEKERASKELYKNHLYSWIISGIILFIFIILIFLCYRHKNKSKNEEYKAKNSILSTLITATEHDNRQLKRELAAKENDLKLAQKFISDSELRYKAISQELKSFLRDRNSVFNKLCGEYFSHEGSSQFGKTAIYNKLKKEIDSFSSSKSINEIKEVVNKTNDDILIKLTAVFNFKEIDIIFLALTIAGFSAPIICYVTDLTSSNYYKKRSRFQAKFKEYHGQYEEEFRSIFI